jgi:hypothetical protein
MKRLILVCALIAVASPAVAGNDPVAVLDSNEQMRLLSEYGRQVDSAYLRMNDFNASRRGGIEASRNAQENLIRLRRKLAETWQTLGLPPSTAKTVAWAYRPRLSPNSQRTSLRERTDEQFATLIQSSLASKNYQLADQTLIDFVTKKIESKANVTSNSPSR